MHTHIDARPDEACLRSPGRRRVPRAPRARLAALAALAAVAATAPPSHAMGEEEFFAEEAAAGHLDLELLKDHGETDACFLYDKRHRAVFCVATSETSGKAGKSTVWTAVFYDGKRDKLTTIPFARRPVPPPETPDDDDGWVARPGAFKKINKRLRKGRWTRRLYELDFGEGPRAPVGHGYRVEVRHDDTELAIYKAARHGDDDAARLVTTRPLDGLLGLYTVEDDLPLIVVDAGPAVAPGAAALRVRLVQRAALRKAARGAAKKRR